MGERGASSGSSPIDLNEVIIVGERGEEWEGSLPPDARLDDLLAAARQRTDDFTDAGRTALRRLSSTNLPEHFRHLRSSDVSEELANYAASASVPGSSSASDGSDARWSERVVLEIFHWSVTAGDREARRRRGLDAVPEGGYERSASDAPQSVSVSGLTDASTGWLDPNINVCDWEGVTCGIITAGAGLGQFPYAIDERCACTDDVDNGSGSTTVETPIENRWKSPDGKKVPCSHGQYVGIIQVELTDAEDIAEEDDLYDVDERRKRRRRRRVACQPPVERPPADAVTKIDLIEYRLSGTLPPELSHLRYLHRLNLNDNGLTGTLPSEYGRLTNLHFLDVGRNALTGTIPPEWSDLNDTLDELWLERNNLTGTLPPSFSKLTVEYFDVSSNQLTGTLPPAWGSMVGLSNAYFEDNQIKGPIPPGWALIPPLRTLDLGSNLLTGSVPADLGYAKDVVELNLSRNKLTGSLSDDMFQLPRLESLVLSHNDLTGDIPSDMNYDDDSEDDDDQDDDDEYGPPDYIWTGVPKIEFLALDHNRFSGTIPPDMLLGISPTIRSLDLSHNELFGTVPAQIGLLNKLERLDLSYCDLDGTVPVELRALDDATVLNLTSNAFTGTVPEAVCNLHMYSEPLYGCDSFLCSPGTFHPDGAANLRGNCVPCTDLDPEDTDEYIMTSTLLGRAHCATVEFVDGDMDGDGLLSEGEVLFLLHQAMGGINWGKAFDTRWNTRRLLGGKHCDVIGVKCDEDTGHVTELDLKEATLCSNREGDGSGKPEFCPGLSPMIALLKKLEVLDLSRSQFLLGTIPTFLGLMKSLRVLDLSLCGSMSGTIPTELGFLGPSLRTLNLAESAFVGTIPTELGKLTNLEKLNLGMNRLQGSLPSALGELASIKEILMSRSHLTGTIAEALGKLSTLENLELYGNHLTGTIPDMSGLKSLKRIDCFNNQLSGTFPQSLVTAGRLQIVHLKNNRLTGSLPANIDDLTLLSWFDLSNNFLTGQIPEGLGVIATLRDIRLGGNRLHGPVPHALCSNSLVNGGRVRSYGCDAIVCPQGTRSHVGFATDEPNGNGNGKGGCIACPEGETTRYLGSRYCRAFTQRDFLSMFFDAMGGETWPEKEKRGWKDADLPECEWAGVSCDAEGKVDGLSFLLSGSSWNPRAF